MFTLDKERLASLMLANSCSGAELARRAGFHRQVISRIITGKQKVVRIDTAGRIASALGVSASAFGHV